MGQCNFLHLWHQKLYRAFRFGTLWPISCSYPRHSQLTRHSLMLANGRIRQSLTALVFNSIPIPIPLRSIPIPIPIPLRWKIAIPIPIPFYPSALRAGGVLSSRSGRAGGCQTCGTHISVTAWWIFSIRSSVELSRSVGVHCYGHMPICPIWACPWAKNLSNLPQIGSRLCGTHISETAHGSKNRRI